MLSVDSNTSARRERPQGHRPEGCRAFFPGRQLHLYLNTITSHWNVTGPNVSSTLQASMFRDAVQRGLAPLAADPEFSPIASAAAWAVPPLAATSAMPLLSIKGGRSACPPAEEMIPPAGSRGMRPWCVPRGQNLVPGSPTEP